MLGSSTCAMFKNRRARLEPRRCHFLFLVVGWSLKVHLMNIYVDCSMKACAPEARKRYTDTLLAFEEELRKAGFTILNFATPNLPFDPHRSEIGDFVRIADAALVFSDPRLSEVQAAFSSLVEEAAEDFFKPRIVCVPSEGDEVTTISSRRGGYYYCEYSSPGFLKETVCTLVRATHKPELATATG